MKRPPKAEDDEREAFVRAMAGVRRLPPDPRERVRAAPNVVHLRQGSGGQGAAPEVPPVSSSRKQEREESADAGFVAPGINRRELRKLKRGDYAAGDTLDLHGLMATEAVADVTRFIDANRGRHRCVAIVHGRGLHSEGNVPILKTRVRACLRQHRAVLAYADAPRTDGGAGAVYVLLRK